MITEKRIMLVLPIVIVILGIFIIFLLCINIYNNFLNGMLVGMSSSFLIIVIGKSKEIEKTLENSKSN